MYNKFNQNLIGLMKITKIMNVAKITEITEITKLVCQKYVKLRIQVKWI